nr:hypothetical protein BaRGS_001108 [Batillaria attramentaria]
MVERWTLIARVLVQTPDRNVFLQIWDTAGQERHRSLSPHIVRDSRSAMLVYDVTNRTSYEEVKRYWLGWIAEHAPPGIRLTLVGNKSDLDARSNLRQVSRKEAKRYAEANGMLFYETSAKTGKNVDVAFLDGVHLLADMMDDDDDSRFEDSVRDYYSSRRQYAFDLISEVLRFCDCRDARARMKLWWGGLFNYDVSVYRSAVAAEVVDDLGFRGQRYRDDFRQVVRGVIAAPKTVREAGPFHLSLAPFRDGPEDRESNGAQAGKPTK